MKVDKIIYWVSTGLVSLPMAMGAFMYLTSNAELVNNFKAVGLPLYLLPFLGIAKLLGVVALLSPILPKVKEWAYAGFAFTLLGATWVHIATATPFIMPVILLLILAVSYFYWNRMAQHVTKAAA